MKKIFKKIKLNTVINTFNAKKLNRKKIKEITSRFSKNEVLLHKKKIFAKLVKKAPKKIEANKELKKIAYEFKLVFNIEANRLLKKHLIDSKKAILSLKPIHLVGFNLLENEEIYLKINNGVFFDIPNIKKFNYNKIKYSLITNKRLVVVSQENNDSYYFNQYDFKYGIKFILVKNKNIKNPAIFLLSSNNSILWAYLQKLKGDK